MSEGNHTYLTAHLPLLGKKLESHIHTEMHPLRDLQIMGDLNVRVARSNIHLAFPNTNHKVFTTNQSKDGNQDRRGNKLLSLLQSNHLSILNGSSVNDSLGSFTSYSFNGASIIDLAILSNHAAYLFQDMRVSSSIISDHMSIQVTVLYQTT